mmetsp:Transcript_51707/g.102932  ORF Transcript_51707/g.102932 Transcript_51707/m.102932 type:complete len:93 (-) Transcript_51707:121-399(-)
MPALLPTASFRSATARFGTRHDLSNAGVSDGGNYLLGERAAWPYSNDIGFGHGLRFAAFTPAPFGASTQVSNRHTPKLRSKNPRVCGGARSE